ETGHALEQRYGGGVDVHADGVHAVFHHRVQAAGQFHLADIVLVLPYADGFGVDLHQLRQWILQAAGDGNGAADGDIEVREFLRGQFGGGVDRRAGLVDDDAAGLELRMRLEQRAYQLVCLPRGGTVA